MTFKPRSYIVHKHCALYKNCSGTAQRLADGGLHGVAAVAALVQAHAGGVYHQVNLVFHYRKIYLKFYACFLKPLYVIFCFKSFDDCFLDYRLTVADAEKVGIYAVALDGEFVKFSYEIFPRECLCALKQLLKRMRLKGAYDYHYTFGKS